MIFILVWQLGFVVRLISVLRSLATTLSGWKWIRRGASYSNSGHRCAPRYGLRLTRRITCIGQIRHITYANQLYDTIIHSFTKMILGRYEVWSFGVWLPVTPIT